MGYKFINVSNNIVLKFGFSHRIIYSVYSNIYCLFINKYLIKLESRSFSDLKKVVYLLRSIRKNSMYKKKGIFLKGSLISLKISSKKAKF
jgi:ribosomal protein L6P/L9E|tara:strand:- start:996 stop:1265 length:270 start_codon:yes stop_codon:yes gene_type:complete